MCFMQMKFFKFELVMINLFKSIHFTFSSVLFTLLIIIFFALIGSGANKFTPDDVVSYLRGRLKIFWILDFIMAVAITILFFIDDYAKTELGYGDPKWPALLVLTIIVIILFVGITSLLFARMNTNKFIRYFSLRILFIFIVVAFGLFVWYGIRYHHYSSFQRQNYL